MENNNIPEEYRPISMWGYFGYEILFSPDRRLHMSYHFRYRCQECKQEELCQILLLLHDHLLRSIHGHTGDSDGNRRDRKHYRKFLRHPENTKTKAYSRRYAGDKLYSSKTVSIVT